MAIADTISSMYENVGEVYDTITNVDLPTNKNIENIPSTIRKSYLDIMNNGIDTIYDNWEKVNGTGTSITLNNTEEAPMTIEYKGNTSQGENPTPEAPQDIHIVSGDNYINVVGKNLFDEVFRQGNISTPSLTTRVFSTQNLYLESGKSYTISTNLNTSLYKYAIALSDTMYPVSSGFYDSGWKTISSFTFTPSRSGYFGLGVAKSNGTDNITPNDISNINWQLEKGTTATEYEAYKGASYEINLGKNLIPFSDIISTGGTTSNGITFTLQADGTIKANGTATAGISIYLTTNYIEQKAGTYTFSDGIASGQSGTTFFLYADVRHLDETSWDTKNFSTAETTTRTRTIEEAFKFKPRIVIRQGQILNNLIFKPMLEEGTSATSYSPYFTPIELCKIGTYQDRIFKSSGKNLFDKSTITSGYRLDGSGIANGSASNEFTSDFIEVESGKTYIRNYGDISAYTRTCFYDKSKSFVSKNDDSQSFTIPDNVKYIRFSEYLSRLDTMQFEKGTSSSSYEPYGKDWYLNKQIGKFTYNNEGGFSTPATNYYNINGLGNQGWITTIQTQTYISTEYPPVSVLNTDSMFREATANMDYAFGIHPNGTGIRFKDSRGLSGEDFKTDLIGTEIYFALATPTYEKITGELLNQLEAIKNSYENQTNINQENNDLPFELEVGALEKL